MSLKNIAFYAIICAVFLGCSKSENDALGRGGELKVPVLLTKCIRRDMEDNVLAKGTLYSRDKAFVSPKLPGKLAKLLVDEGDTVKEGQELAQIEQDQILLARDSALLEVEASKAALSGAKENVARLEAELERVKADYQRMERLYVKQSIAEQKYEHAFSELRVQEAELKAAGYGVEAAESRQKQAEVRLETAKTQLNDTRILSPINGIVTEKYMNTGEMSAPGTPIFAVETVDRLEAKIQVSSKVLSRLKTGLPVRVYVDGFNNEPALYKIDEIHPSVDEKLRTVDIKSYISNNNLKYKPGLFCRAEVILDSHTNTLAVLQDAVVKRDGAAFVFRNAGGRAEKSSVTAGLSQGDYLEILSGLNEGDEVVLKGHDNLVGGETLSIQEE